MSETSSLLRRLIREVYREYETGDPARDLSDKDREDYRQRSVAASEERLGIRRRSASERESAAEEQARLDRQYKDNVLLAKQADAAIARRDAEWKKGEPERKAREAVARSAESAELKEKTIAAIKKYGEEYKSSRQLPLFDVLRDIFVPGVRLKADAAIKKSSYDLYRKVEGMKNKSWDEVIKLLDDEM